MEDIRVEINEQGRKQIVVPATKAYAIFIKWAAEKHGVELPEIPNDDFRWDMPEDMEGWYPFDEERSRKEYESRCRREGECIKERTRDDLEKEYWVGVLYFLEEDEWHYSVCGMDKILWEILRDDAQYRVSEYEEKEAGLRR